MYLRERLASSEEEAKLEKKCRFFLFSLAVMLFVVYLIS